MADYRILKTTIGSDRPTYTVQKKFLGFLWWYNPLNIDGLITGQYETFQGAKDAIDRMTANEIKEVVYPPAEDIYNG